MNKCAHCQTTLDDDELFCHHCGKPVIKKESPRGQSVARTLLEEYHATRYKKNCQEDSDSSHTSDESESDEEEQTALSYICGDCGAPLEEEDVVCPQCGNEITEENRKVDPLLDAAGVREVIDYADFGPVTLSASEDETSVQKISRVGAILLVLAVILVFAVGALNRCSGMV